jgi:hypothetical protein
MHVQTPEPPLRRLISCWSGNPSSSSRWSRRSKNASTPAAASPVSRGATRQPCTALSKVFRLSSS